jgi:CMP-N,N'-diacetyllegionaminic acid synthase
MSVLALIPARSGSKGIPGKNVRKLGGRTLVQHAVACAWAAGPGRYVSPPVEGLFVVVSTNIDRRALALNEPDNMRVEVLPRPAELAQDDTPMIAVVQHALAQIPGPEDQIIVLLQPTQPFRTPEHLKAAIALLGDYSPDPMDGPDSVVSVVAVSPNYSPELLCEISGWGLQPWIRKDIAVQATWRWAQVPTRRQDTTPLYRRDGTVYAFWRRTVNEYANIYGSIVEPLIIPAHESCELDTEQDWEDVEARWRTRHG